MLLDFATNPKGVTYAYFICSGRAAKKTTCTRRAVPVAVAERLVADSYASITISDNTYQRLAADVDAAFDDRNTGQDQDLDRVTSAGFRGLRLTIQVRALPRPRARATRSLHPRYPKPRLNTDWCPCRTS